MSTLLITTAVSPPEGVPLLKLKSHLERQVSTKASIYFWMLSGIRNIVIADATNTHVLSDSDLHLAKSIGINIEQLIYDQDAISVQQRGKGYGEAKLIEFALQSSALLQSTDNFFKCTGKLFVNNFLAISNLILQNNIKSVFWRWSDGLYNFTNDYIDTRFYYVDRKTFDSKILRFLLSTDERTASNLERQAYKSILPFYNSGLFIRPVIIGYGGGGGELHQNLHFGSFENSFPCWYTLKD